MKKILTVIGARPQFVKASAVSHVLRKSFKEVLVHTGQHYDENMSKIFFEELEIPTPDYNLGVGSGSHGEQTGRMLIELEKVVMKEVPDMLLTYGDTNSTLACALVGAKLHIPVAHIEAGLRSFDRKMPEEINRVVTDHVSSLLFCPTRRSVEWLRREGITDGVYEVGDVMYDSVLANIERAKKKENNILQEFNLQPKSYFLATVHRPANTDSKENLMNIFKAYSELDYPVVVPLHPRTRKFLDDYGISVGGDINIIEPVGYLDMLMLLSNAKKLITDSGGMQKEAYFLKVPCVTVRDTTEWVETVEVGANVLVEPVAADIKNAVADERVIDFSREIYGDGHASEKIVQVLIDKG